MSPPSLYKVRFQCLCTEGFKFQHYVRAEYGLLNRIIRDHLHNLHNKKNHIEVVLKL